MIQKKDILKMVKSVHRHSRGAVPRKNIDPEREWLFILIGSLVVVVLGITYSAYTYNYYSELDNNLTTSDSSVVRYDNISVDRVIEKYRDKEKTFNNTIGNVVPVTSPEVIPVTEEDDGVVEDSNSLESGTPVEPSVSPQAE